MARRYEDWLAQARCDLRAAKDSLEAGHYEWSAIQAQQGAEKVLKARLRYDDLEPTGHTLLHLLREVETFLEVPRVYQERARELDRHYLQPRCPNSFAAGYPAEFYDEATARRCAEYAGQFIAFVEESISWVSSLWIGPAVQGEGARVGVSADIALRLGGQAGVHPA